MKLVATSSLIGLILVGGLAWACTPSAYLNPLEPSQGAQGTRVTVTGAKFEPREVEIRWNGREGAMLGTASGPSFSVQVTIPAAADGVYYVTAVQRVAGGSDLSQVRSQPFDVVSAESQVLQPRQAPVQNGNSTPSQSPAPGETQPAGAPSTQPGSPAPAAQRPAGGVDISIPIPDGGAEPASRAPSGTQAQTTPAQAASSSSPAAQSPASAREAGQAPASQQTAAPAPTGDQPAPAAAAPSSRSTTTDLWSGFAPFQGASRAATGLDSANSTSGGVPSMIGAGILAVGLAALLAGFALAGSQRRRASARREVFRGGM